MPTFITYKAAITMLLACITYIFGADHTAYLVLFILCFIDSVSGVVKAKVLNEKISSKFRNKIFHYMAYCGVIASFNVMTYMSPGVQYIGDAVVIWLSLGEMISLLENLDEVGIPTPMYLKKFLVDLRNKDVTNK